MIEQTAEPLGRDLNNQSLASLCNSTWGQVKLKAKNKEDLFEAVEVPGNCPVMRTLPLNSEIYNRLYESAQRKDGALRDRQKEIVKAAVPLYQALSSLEDSQKLLSDDWKKRRGEGGNPTKIRK